MKKVGDRIEIYEKKDSGIWYCGHNDGFFPLIHVGKHCFHENDMKYVGAMVIKNIKDEPVNH